MKGKKWKGTVEIDFEGSMVHPNYITGWCMNSHSKDWNKGTQAVLGRLFAISSCLTQIPAGVALDIAKGERKVTHEGWVLTIHPRVIEEE